MSQQRVEAQLLSVSIGVSEPLDLGSAYPGRTVESAIRKRPVSDVNGPAAIEVRKLGLAGDEQADLSVHGGLDKAAYLYPIEHYPWWRERRIEARVPGAEVPLACGAFGENLTTQGVLEQDLWIGDTLVIGDVEFNVEAPRNPCFKFNAVMGYNRAVRHMYLSGFSGVYLSVRKTGFIRAGSKIDIIPGRRDESIASLLDWRRSRARREP